MFTAGLYLTTVVLLIYSAVSDKKKTRMAIKKSWKSFEYILPQFLAVILLIGLILTLLSPEVISKIIGDETGWPGMVLASIVGSVTLIPGFVAFPLAAKLMESGGGLMQITVFVSTLMAVGVVTLSVEMQYFGKKIPILRNLLAFFYCFLVALFLGGVLS